MTKASLLLAVVLLALWGCRAHPRVARRIVVADTDEGRQCFADAQEGYRQCMSLRMRRGLCVKSRDQALLRCPEARDASGEPDPSVVLLPGYRP
jgi:hypothetical protein